MSLSHLFRRPWLLNVRMFCVSIGLMSVATGIFSVLKKPRVWPAVEVPIAFWAWRNQTPTEVDVRAAIDKTQARAIFLRAGQIDYQSGKLSRIRPVSGPLPQGIDLHLVYNATRSLLAQLEQIDENVLAETIAAAYLTDTERASQQNARVIGLQIDIDVPTRLLGRYGKALSALRKRLKSAVQLSITGLPTWMSSPDLRAALAQVDFWTPQLYGAEIPQHSDQVIPISSPETVALFVSRASALNKPFYAGLAAYSCALLYSPSGSLISLRGDMDPSAIASDSNLEIIERRPFAASTRFNASAGGAAQNTEWRYVYRARADGVTDDLAMRAGDLLVVDVPSAESLRLSAQIVRELAGKKLLGICVFRLPAGDDPATLTVDQVASALADRDSVGAVEVRLKLETPVASGEQTEPRSWVLEVKNTGTASAIVGGLKIDLRTDPGTVASFTPQGLAAVEYLCAAHADTSLEPCSQRRANVVRFEPRTLMPGQLVTARLILNRSPPRVVAGFLVIQTHLGESF
jgi:hypothetical protein